MELKEFIQNKQQLLFKKEYARAPRYAKNVTHKITPFIVFYFSKLNITPNQVTFFSLITGVLACFFKTRLAHMLHNTVRAVISFPSSSV